MLGDSSGSRSILEPEVTSVWGSFVCRVVNFLALSEGESSGNNNNNNNNSVFIELFFFFAFFHFLFLEA